MPNQLLIPTPKILGLPAKFNEWQGLQELMISEIIESPQRFVIQNIPTGGGKSCVNIASALINGGKTVILTATKALQDQYNDDFGDLISVVKGMNAYKCRLHKSVSCDKGECNFGVECKYREHGCYYYDAVEEAKSSDIVVMNYAYWITMKKVGIDFPKPAMLICDEGHEALEILVNSCAVSFTDEYFHTITGLHIPLTNNIIELLNWGRDTLPVVKDMFSEISGEIRKGKNTENNRQKALLLYRVVQQLEEMMGVSSKWRVAYDDTKGREKVTAFPIDKISLLLEEYLWQGVDKIVLSSGTINKITASMLGLTTYSFTDYPSLFEVNRRKIYHVPTVKVNHKITDSGIDALVSKMDRVISMFPNCKGIIQCGSFDRKDEVLRRSRYRDLMYHNTRFNLTSVLKEFKLSDTPAILVSPSVTKGYDFPYDLCRYQVILKVPFPNLLDIDTLLLQRIDGRFINYITMQNLQQMCGRGTRRPDDYCATFILDDIVEWFVEHFKKTASHWFLEAYMPKFTLPMDGYFQRELEDMRVGVIK